MGLPVGSTSAFMAALGAVFGVFDILGPEGRAAAALERFTYRRADAVTVLSDDLRDNVAAKLVGHRPERVQVIPNFVDTERIAPAVPPARGT